MSLLTLIVAATLTNGIGQSGRLPWRLPKEMAYFSRTTTNAPEGSVNAVIMGRNTWESIPEKHRPLKERENIVISRNDKYELYRVPTGGNATAHLHGSLASALTQISGSQHGGNDKPIHRTFIIGGASLYKETLMLPPSTSSASPPPPSSAFVDRILLTQILQPAFEDCDTFMPDFEELAREDGGKTSWRKTTHEELEAWVGFEVPRSQVENGVNYEFQMWVRLGSIV